MSTTTKFNLTKDLAGYNTFGVRTSNEIRGVFLASGVAQSTVTPSDSTDYAVLVSITPGANVFVDFTGATATAYTGTLGPVTSELNPQVREVKAGQSISVITPDAGGAYVEISFYIVNQYTN
jgi:hypothetical protein